MRSAVPRKNEVQIWDLPVRKPALQGECFPKIRIFLRKHHHNRMKAKGNQIESPLIWLHDRKISSQCRPPFFMKKVYDSGKIWRFLARSVHQRCLTHLFMLQAVCRPYVYRNRTSNDEGLICVLTYYVGKALQNISQIWLHIVPFRGKWIWATKVFIGICRLDQWNIGNLFVRWQCQFLVRDISLMLFVLGMITN